MGELCKDWGGVPATPAPLKARIAAACGRGGAPGIVAKAEPVAKPQSVAVPARGASDWQRGVFGGN